MSFVRKVAGVGVALLGLAALWLWSVRLDSFLPDDEGLLGQTAERVLQGEWPHLDFDDTYTGGLALYHAAIFEIAGVSSAQLRVALWLASLLFLGLFFGLCLFARPEPTSLWGAALATLVALTWSLPNYFAPLPSWYNLFLATAGLAALWLFDRDGRRRWLALAGFCGGLSILVKIVGVFFLAAALLAAIFTRQRRHVAGDADARSPSGILSVALGLVAASCAAGLWLIFRQNPSPSNLLYFVLPILGLALLLIREEGRPKKTPAARRLMELGGDAAALGGGALLPILVFLVPYLRAEDGLVRLWRGLVVAPMQRVELVAYPLPTPTAFLIGLPILVLVLIAARNRSRAGYWLLALACAAVVAFGDQENLHVAVWRAARLLVPFSVLDGIWRLWRREPGEGDTKVFSALVVLAFFSLVQYPFARGFYFCYVAPLLVLAIYTLWTTRRMDPKAPSAGMVTIAAMFGLFAFVWLNGSAIHAFGRRYVPVTELVALDEERISLRVAPGYARGYRDLIGFIREQVPPDQPILALPDLPQIYFFAGRRNPTRILNDALAVERPTLEQYRAWLAEVGLVVINRRPEFAAPIDPELDRAIAQAFPRKATLENLEIRYRDRAAR